MSRKNEKKIQLDPAVKAELHGRLLQISGPKGALRLNLPEGIKVALPGDRLVVTSGNQDRASLGLYGALITNLVTGVSLGFVKSLEMAGLGFKVKKEGRNLILTIGFSHPVKYSPPEGCEIEVSEDSKITVSGIDKGLVGEVAAQIRKLKPPEPYKGKGIRYQGEVVRRKAGKAGKVGVAK